MSYPAVHPSNRARLPGLDGVRALAIVLVMAYHLFPGLAPGGFVGVDVFFVVSGYLITALLLAEYAGAGRITLGRFWARRARRLLPALVIMVSTSVTAAALLGGDVLVDIGWQLAGAASFSSNWLAIAQGSSYLDQSNPELLRHLWSLAVEEQFYLLWPLALGVILTLSRPKWRVLVPLLLAGASAASMASGAGALGGGAASSDAMSHAYYSTLTHAFGLLAGAALAIARAPLTAGIARAPRLSARQADALAAGSALGIVVGAAWLSLDSTLAYRGGLALVVVLTLTLIIALDHPGGAAAAVADAPIPRWIGERSYGLYLWHWPVIVLLSAALSTLDQSGWARWMLGGVALAVTVALAAASYSWVEQPVRRTGWAALGPRLPKQKALRGLVGAVAVVSLGAGPAVAVIRAPLATQAELSIAAGEAALRLAAQSRSSPVQLDPIVGRDASESRLAERPSEPSPQPAPPSTDQAEPVVPAAPLGAEILAIGDSVLLASAPALHERFPGIAIDAVVARQMKDAPQLLREHAAVDGLRPVVVLALGTNGPVEIATLDEVREILGPDRELVLVTAQAPREWTEVVNANLAEYAARHRTVELCDWRAAIQPHLNLLAGDQIHPGVTGAELYASALAEPLTRLAVAPRTSDLLREH
jgi:peptidoglycan/LPS O-acetylase OafA/YrhL